MNYNLFIKLPSSFNSEISEDEKFNILYAVLKTFSDRLTTSSLCLSVNINQSSYMLEGNQDITLQIKAKFEKNVDKNQIKSLLKDITPQKVGIITFNNSEKAIFGASIDTRENFIDSENVAFINNLSEFPKDLHSIEFSGIYARTSGEKPTLILNFFDKNNNKIKISNPWVNKLKDAYSNTFSAHDIDDLPLSHLIRLMIGKNPSQELSNAFNNKIMVTTLYMKETMRFNKYKNLEDCPIYLDFE
jgi:hypothetical protein